MINFFFLPVDANVEMTWTIPIKEHSPEIEKRSIVLAEAGDFIDPDVIYKGSYIQAKIETLPLPASEFDTFKLFRDSSSKGRSFIVQGSVVPLFGYDYTAIRMGELVPKSLHQGQYFEFDLLVRVLGPAF